VAEREPVVGLDRLLQRGVDVGVAGEEPVYAVDVQIACRLGACR
jgi:hypothetical protein